MVVKVKEYFDKTRHVKNNDKSKKFVLRGHRNARYHEKYYQIKRNLIISILLLIQYKCIFSQLSSVQKGI